MGQPPFLSPQAPPGLQTFTSRKGEAHSLPTALPSFATAPAAGGVGEVKARSWPDTPDFGDAHRLSRRRRSGRNKRVSLASEPLVGITEIEEEFDEDREER